MPPPRTRIAYLVADDSPLVAKHLAELLVDAGVSVVGPAHDGREALRLFREARPQGAVLDFDMPHASGLDVLRAIRAEPGGERCLVIVLTAHADPSLADACLAAGADHFLYKTDGVSQLHDIVGAHTATVTAGCRPSPHGQPEQR